MYYCTRHCAFFFRRSGDNVHGEAHAIRVRHFLMGDDGVRGGGIGGSTFLLSFPARECFTGRSLLRRRRVHLWPVRHSISSFRRRRRRRRRRRVVAQPLDVKSSTPTSTTTTRYHFGWWEEEKELRKGFSSSRLLGVQICPLLPRGFVCACATKMTRSRKNKRARSPVAHSHYPLSPVFSPAAEPAGHGTQ